MYPEPNEQAKKLGLFGLAGALANTIALVLAGVFLLASWRWYFRFITIITAPFATLAWFLMPKVNAVAEDLPGTEKWKRMDLGGVFILVAGLILFILGFTQAPNEGWHSAIFIAPLVVSIVLLVGFLFWERFMKRCGEVITNGDYSSFRWRLYSSSTLAYRSPSICATDCFHVLLRRKHAIRIQWWWSWQRLLAIHVPWSNPWYCWWYDRLYWYVKLVGFMYATL